jgi:ribosome-associated toxin RatA of RatAB toxin-antitoxin module
MHIIRKLNYPSFLPFVYDEFTQNQTNHDTMISRFVLSNDAVGDASGLGA